MMSGESDMRFDPPDSRHDMLIDDSLGGFRQYFRTSLPSI